MLFRERFTPSNGLVVLFTMTDAALASQRASGDNIRRFVTNTDKVGVAALTIDVLNTRTLLLENYWKVFSDRHGKIFARYADLKEHDYFAQDHYSNEEYEYICVKTVLTTRITAKVEELQLTIDTLWPLKQLAISQVATASNSLPKVALPPFSGKYEDWESFKQRFC